MRLLRKVLVGIHGNTTREGSVSMPGALLGDHRKTTGESRSDALVFARNFFAHPKMLGSLIPSSSFLINRLLSRVDWERARTIVEFGPGTGCFTRQILKRLHSEGSVIAIEMNSDFVSHLRREVRDPRLKVYHGSAADVRHFLQCSNIQHADCLISGIPFSTISPTIRESILKESAEALGSNGQMLVYQFSGKVLPDLRRTFSRVETDFEPFNILPARLFYCSSN